MLNNPTFDKNVSNELFVIFSQNLHSPISAPHIHIVCKKKHVVRTSRLKVLTHLFGKHYNPMKEKIEIGEKLITKICNAFIT